MIYRVLSYIIESLVIIISLFIVGIVTIEVVLRYGFGSSLFITEELTRNLMVILVFIGASIGFRDSAHISVTFFVEKLPERFYKWAKLFAHLLTVLFLAILIISGSLVLPDRLHRTLNTINIPVFFFYLAIPLGSLLMIVFLIPHIKSAFQNGQPVKEQSSEQGNGAHK